MHHLVVLSITNNRLKFTNTFHTPRLLVLQTNDFRLCCFIPSLAKCTSKTPWFRSCRNILSNMFLKITFYCVSTIIITFNLISLFLQIVIYKRKIEKSCSFGLIVGSVNLSDISYAITLCILWSGDLYYKRQYVRNDLQWRSGIPCFIIFGMTINFHFITLMLLFFLSVSRLMVVVYPLDSSFKRTSYVIKYLFFIFGISIIISIVIPILVSIVYGNLPINLCSPFIDPTNENLFIKAFSWIIAFAQLLTTISIIVIYCLLLKYLKESQANLKESTSKKNSNIALIVQLIIVTGSNILCWLPNSIIYLMSMYLSKYSIEMIYWTTVAVVPINSIINPMVFIISNLRKMTN